MACKKERVPFSGTPEQEAALKKVIAEHSQRLQKLA